MGNKPSGLKGFPALDDWINQLFCLENTDPSFARKAKQYIYLSLLAALISLPFLILAISYNELTKAAVIVFQEVVLLFVLFYIKHFKTLNIIGDLLVFAILVVIDCVIYINGSVFSSSSYWILCFASFISLIGNIRFIVKWSSIMSASIIVLGYWQWHQGTLTVSVGGHPMDFYRFFGAYSLIVIFLVVNERTIYLHEQKLSDLIDLYTLQLVGNTAPEHEPAKNQKDEVISIISAFSQEIRTPLIAVLGFTRFLEHRIAADLDEKCLRALQLTIKNAEDLVTFSSDLLEIETMKYGEIKDRFEDVNLNVLMDEVVQSLLPLAQLKEIIIVKQFFHVVNIEGNRIKLKQAFINLISNSIKYTREGKITVQLDIRENTALVVIADTGIGMTTAQLSKLFEGLQSFSAESVRLGSTGLGLTIAKEIFNYHNGVIEASSKKYEGNVFTVNLPLCQ